MAEIEAQARTETEAANSDGSTGPAFHFPFSMPPATGNKVVTKITVTIRKTDARPTYGKITAIKYDCMSGHSRKLPRMRHSTITTGYDAESGDLLIPSGTWNDANEWDGLDATPAVVKAAMGLFEKYILHIGIPD